MKGNSFLQLFSIVILVVMLFLVNNIQLIMAQEYTNVTGIINSNTTWTKDSSPFLLDGPILVNQGVTLTIETGVEVNLHGYYIQVEGTLRAIGTETDQIRIYGNIDGNGGVIFKDVSLDWDEQTSSGCIVENARVSEMKILESSPKINKNKLYEVTISDGSPIISNNTVGTTESITYFTIGGGSPLISNNVFIRNQIEIQGGSPIISNNNITGTVKGQIHDNEMYSPYYGINILGANDAYICDNIILRHEKAGINAVSGTAIIERNLIMNHYTGIYVDSAGVIQNNTITGNSYGLRGSLSTSTYDFTTKTYHVSVSTIKYNNIQNNTYHNIYLETSNDIDVANNWWGTTDTQAINQTIRDFKNDFNLGTVTFTPFLTEANPQAPSSITSEIPEFTSLITLLFANIILVVAVTSYRQKLTNFRNSKKPKH